jgi:hypothetical protein
MTTPLHLTVAKLELKQLEMLDKIRKNNDEYIIRLITSTVTDKFVTLNGDWGLVTGRDEECCVDGGWENIVPEYELPKIHDFVDEIKSGNAQNELSCKLKSYNNKTIDVLWRGKYFPEINGIIFIGKVKK